MSLTRSLTQADIDRLAAVPVPEGRLLIDGAFCDGGAEPLTVLSPINGQHLTTIAAGSEADVARATAAARRAFDDGRRSRQSSAARKAVLLRLADLIERHAFELAVLGVRDNGTEIGMALKAEPLSAAQTFRWYGEALDKLYGEIAPTAETVLALIHREPVGVVAAIVPWNFPLMIGAWKLAPALASGNSVVLKPAETASLTLLRLGELALEAGLPAGGAECGHRVGFGRRGGPGAVDGCRCAGVHRVRGHRAAADGIFGGLEPETALSGTWRQEPQHRLCRCARPCRRRQDRRRRHPPQCRPGLWGRLAVAGRGVGA